MYKKGVPDRRFENQEVITSISFGKDCTFVGESSFSNCTSLESINDNNAITDVYSHAFSKDTKLSSVTFNKVNSIGESAFSECKNLKNININNKCSNIGKSAFKSCESLKKITIPNGITTIEESTFEGCSSLSEVAIPDNVVNIGSNAFSGCTGLKKVQISDIAKWCNIDFNGSDKTNPLTYAERLYLNNDEVVELIIPNKVTHIKKNTFYNCKSLKKIEIHKDLEQIGTNAFEGCDNIDVVYNFSPHFTVDKTDNNGGIGKNAKTIINGDSMDGNFVFKDNTLIVYCGDNEEIVILPENNNGVNYAIGAEVFKDHKEITSVVFSNGVTNIGDRAFYDCISITVVTIPDNVISIGNSAFCNCYDIEEISIGKGVNSIGDRAFYGCRNIERIHVDNIKDWCNISFGGKDIFSSPKELNPSENEYKTNLYLNGNLIKELIIPDDISTIKKYAFYGCSNITSVEIPSGVTSIENDAFGKCLGIGTIYNFSSLNIDNTVNNGSIGFNADNIYNYPNGVKINDYLFKKEDNTYILSNYLGNMINPILPTSYKGEKYEYEIGSAFSGNTDITNINIPDSVTRICDSAFSGCSYIFEVVIGTGVTSIGNYAFYECNDLTTIKIPESVTNIGDSAFNNCSKLNEVEFLSKTPPTIGTNVFNFKNLSLKIYVPSGCKTTYIAQDNWSIYSNYIVEKNNI